MALDPFTKRSVPSIPIPVGTLRHDSYRDITQVWNGTRWDDADIQRDTIFVPLPEELEKYPTLKAAWEEFLTIKKLTGV